MRGRLISWRPRRSGIAALICSFVLTLAVFGGEDGQEPKRFVFELEEVSTFELDRQAGFSFIEGQRSYCTEKPSDEVRAYPVFKSDKPLYGSVEFRSDYDGNIPRKQYYFALDESNGTGQGYDRFYFDINRDLDLRNDAVLSPHKDPPNKNWLRDSSAKKNTTFEYLHIPFEFGSEGMRPIEILPWFVITSHLPPLVKFVNPKLHKSKIELDGRRYDVRLGHDYIIAGWFDQPLTAAYLIPEGELYRPSWRDANRLMAVHKIGGIFYQFSASPKGDKVIAQEYNGPFGIFEIRPGRGIKPGMITAGGSFRSREMAVALGGPKYRLPVGDYLPAYVTIVFVDHMMISLSDNYHADGEPRGAVNGPRNYAIKIRQDKPYILDFSNDPEVIFASPAKDHRLKLGEELSIKAVLVDPKLDLMIRDLEMIVSKRSANGKNRIGETLPLDPTLTITRADGQKVAEGIMPFG